MPWESDDVNDWPEDNECRREAALGVPGIDAGTGWQCTYTNIDPYSGWVSVLCC